MYLSFQKLKPGLSSGPVVKNLPANAGDTSSIPGQGRFHVPQTNKARVPRRPTPKCLEPVLCNNRNHRGEKPVLHDKRAALLQLKKAHAQQRRPNTAKTKINFKILKKKKIRAPNLERFLIFLKIPSKSATLGPRSEALWPRVAVL